MEERIVRLRADLGARRPVDMQSVLDGSPMGLLSLRVVLIFEEK
jgi:hypothetical protein